MAGLAEGLTKALERVVQPALEKAGERLRVVPEAAARGTAERPAILERALRNAPKEGELPAGVREAGKDVPFAGPEKFRQPSRTVPTAERESLANIVDDAKVRIAGLWKAEPGLPKDIGDAFSETRGIEKRIRQQVELELRDDVMKPIAGLGKESFAKARRVWDFMVNADRAAQAAAQGLDEVDGIPKKDLEALVASTWNALDPVQRDVHERVRRKYDEAFELAIARGFVKPEQRLEAYSPIRRMAMVLNAMFEERGETGVETEKLAQFLRRGISGGVRQTDGLTLLTDYLTSIRRRIAQEDLLAQLVADKTIHFTDHPEIATRLATGKPLPPGLSLYELRPGRIGYIKKNPAQQVMDGVLDHMNMPKGRDRGRALVFPDRIVKALETYSPRVPGDDESAIYKLGRAYTRAFTVYNPAVTAVNFASDHVLALSRAVSEGGAAQALGFLREWPDAVKSAVGGVFFDKGGEKFERALREGLTSSTYTSEAGGLPVSDILKEFHEAPARSLMQTAKEALAFIPDQLAKGRQAVELMPKIAAGEEALRRTGDLSAYGKIGKDITIDFTKAPAATRNPTFQFMAPFYAFFGAATPYVLEMAKKNGGRNPMLAAIVAVPTTTMLWNYQNEEFAKVERSLPEHEQMNLHVIIADAEGHVLRDPTGRPVVKRLQYWVPEEVAKMFGLGNLPSRLRQVTEGRVTPSEFASQSGSAAAKQWVGHIMPAKLALEFGMGRSWYSGEEIKRSEALAGAIPQTKMVHNFILGAKSYGLKEQALRTGSEAFGLSQAGLEQRGTASLDAALMDAKRDLQKARLRMRRFLIRQDTAGAQEAMKDMAAARDRLKRVATAIRAEGRKPKVSMLDLTGNAAATEDEQEIDQVPGGAQ